MLGCQGLPLSLLVLSCLAVEIPPRPAQIPTTDCTKTQYYDLERDVCLDICGAYNEERCGIEQYCSSRVKWADEWSYPMCLHHCFRECSDDEYCDQETSHCQPCELLCDEMASKECRVFCYDVFRRLTTPLETTSTKLIKATAAETVSINMGAMSTSKTHGLEEYFSWMSTLMVLIMTLLCIMCLTIICAGICLMSKQQPSNNHCISTK